MNAVRMAPVSHRRRVAATRRLGRSRAVWYARRRATGGEKKMFQPGLLAGKKILVTGGGTGLGAAMGRRFVELGAELVICGRRLEVLEETAAAFRRDL